MDTQVLSGRRNLLPTVAVITLITLVAVCRNGAAAQPSFADVLERLERTERQLSDTQAELDFLRQRDMQRQQWESSFPQRLPSVDPQGHSAYVPARTSRSVHDDAPMPPTELQAQVQQLGAGVTELGEGLEKLKEGAEELGKALRVTTLDENIKIGIFGWARGEALFTDQTTVLLAAPFFVTPDFPGVNQENVRVHGRSTGIGAGIEGPCICGYESGGLILIYFFGNSVLSNSVGVFVAQAYGELKNDHSRIAFGIQSDIVGPRNPTVVNWGMYNAGGNTGFLRGQLRYERYFHPRPDRQWTMTVGISDPAPTNLAAALPDVAFAGSNGWPNVEGRLALGLGCEYQEGLETRRAIEIGVSGMVGEIRTNLPNLPEVPLPPVPGPVIDSVVDDAYYAGFDVRAALTDRFGFQGEVFAAKGAGTYAAAILQTIDVDTLQTVRSEGGWGEVYYYWTSCLHSHVGYGIDNPRDEDLTVLSGARTRNDVYFANLMWDVTKNFQVAFEYSHWQTDYINPLLPDSEANVYHVRVQYAF